jgi:hypothetical protein
MDINFFGIQINNLSQKKKKKKPPRMKKAGRMPCMVVHICNPST